MKSNIEIAREAKLLPIQEIASGLGIGEENVIAYGRHKAKIPLHVINEDAVKKSNLILVTAISPTKAGVGKTVSSVSLALGLHAIGKKAIVALREPSLGPVFGMKGGAAGGGYAQVLPMEDINLHFTGDFHAITSAHNTLTALLYNYQRIHHGTEKELKKILWKRVLDVNDRSLRYIITTLEGKDGGVEQVTGFDITAASEIMAILCLAENLDDLKTRIGNIILGFTKEDKPFTVSNLGVEDAVTILLKDALQPNLVQTTENTAALIHGGPFANIAHGCNSVLATKMAMSLADYVVTEAGFGSDLGAEKFMNIKCRVAGIFPKASVIVVTTEALKNHAGLSPEAAKMPDMQALQEGLPNLERHIQIMQEFGQPIVVALNKFHFDIKEEIDFLHFFCESKNIAFAVNDAFAKGSAGAQQLATVVVDLIEKKAASGINFTYDNNSLLEEKILSVAKKIYHASDVVYSDNALKTARAIGESRFVDFPVCIAKTQYSFTDNPKITGAPSGHTLHIDDVIINAGAGFIVAVAGEMMRMPGLPKVPAAYRMRIENGMIEGLT
jgi:formate--tetrahydrofolate ligase